MEIIAIANQKGGVGKSTTAHNFGQWLRLAGYKVLFIDLDNQQNLSYTMGASLDRSTAYELLSGEATATEAIQETKAGDIIAASPQLAGSDRTITGVEQLKKAIAPIKNKYDFVILDCPPSLSILTINALTAASRVIIPSQSDIYSLQALKQLSEIIETVRTKANPDLKIAGILITRYNGRAILSRDFADMLTDTANQMKTKVFENKIREAIAIKEAQAMQADIFTYSARSGAAKDYNGFITELLTDIAENGKK